MQMIVKSKQYNYIVEITLFCLEIYFPQAGTGLQEQFVCHERLLLIDYLPYHQLPGDMQEKLFNF